MERWQRDASAVYAALASEIISQAGTHATTIGVDGSSGADLGRVVEGLAAALSAQNVAVRTVSPPSNDLDTLRSDTVQPFKSAAAADASALIVSGRGVLDQGPWTLWRWSLWAETDADAVARRADGKLRASAVLDVTDPAHPRRNWNDAC